MYRLTACIEQIGVTKFPDERPLPDEILPRVKLATLRHSATLWPLVLTQQRWFVIAPILEHDGVGTGFQIPPKLPPAASRRFSTARAITAASEACWQSSAAVAS